MSVTNTKAKSVYNANGTTKEWNLGFTYDDTVSNVHIYIVDANDNETEVTSNYSIANGVLTYPTTESGLDPLAEGNKLVIVRDTPRTQDIELTSNGKLDGKVLEGGYDKLTLQVQELTEQVNRAVKIPVTEESADNFLDPITAITEAKQEALAEIAQATTPAKTAKDTAVAKAQVATEQATIATKAATSAKAAQAGAEAAEQNATAQAEKAEKAVTAYTEGLGTAKNAVIDLGTFDGKTGVTSSRVIDFDRRPIAVSLRFSDTNKKLWINGTNSTAGIEVVDDKHCNLFYSIASADFAGQNAVKSPFVVQAVIQYSVLASSASEQEEGVVQLATKAEAEAGTNDTKAMTPLKTKYAIEANATVKTLRNDIDDLGDQVAVIEGKIPAEASTTNQLADKNFVTTITDELAADITALEADKQNKLTPAQLNAVNSGITSDKVTQYNNYATTKQDKLTAGANITISADNVISATGGGETPTNMVTTDTYQEITGRKDFSNTVYLNSEVKVKTGISFQNGATGIKSGTTSSSSGVTVGDYSVPVEIYTSGFNINTKHPSNGAVRPATLNGKQIATVDDVAAAGGDNGIKGDYCTTYGILEAPNGILTNPSGMQVTLKQGVVLQLAGQDIKTTVSGDMTQTLTSTADCDLFYVSGTTSLMEVAQIVWSKKEPDNGATGVLAWWNPDNKKWKFKSNDTGNVWAEAVATPVAHIHTNGTTITRIDHIGYRVMDDEIYALKSDVGNSNRPLGEVYFSQSGLASDNPGALPGWTGEYYENGKTLFPDLYNFVKAHSELQVTKAQYDSAIATYGECPKYVVDENSKTSISTETATGYSITIQDVSSTSTSTQGIAKALSITMADILLTQTPKVGDFIYTSVSTTTPVVNPADLESGYKCEITGVTYTEAGILATIAWNDEGATYGPYKVTEISEISITNFPITVSGTSLRLPKRQTAGRYLVKKEVNGNNWYALYSDGWLEQGGYFANPQTIGTGAITETFWKPYAAPPTLLFGNMSPRGKAAYDSEHYPYDVTATGFTHQNIQPQGQGTRWYAFGYAADTPMENIMYPWIVSYTSAVPASTAQAAEFTGALSGKANTDLSNVLANIDYVVESKVPTESDPSWYRKYKSGWLEQGGLVASTSGATGTVQTLLKPFANANYTLTATARGTFDRTFLITSKTATTFSCAYSSSAVGAYDWRAEGLGAN